MLSSSVGWYFGLEREIKKKCTYHESTSRNVSKSKDIVVSHVNTIVNHDLTLGLERFIGRVVISSDDMSFELWCRAFHETPELWNTQMYLCSSIGVRVDVTFDNIGESFKS